MSIAFLERREQERAGRNPATTQTCSLETRVPEHIQNTREEKAISRTDKTRGELKYLLDEQAYQALMNKIDTHLEFDEYPCSHVKSIYLDTLDNAMIRRSIEKPRFKEKLRIRTYCDQPSLEDRCFLEIKKKFKGVVYKRRVGMLYLEALEFCQTKRHPSYSFSLLSDEERQISSQILKEAAWLFASHDDLQSSFIIDCERTAYKEKGTDSLRLTFDDAISWSYDGEGQSGRFTKVALLDSGVRVMEIKSTKGLPEWLTNELSALRIYPRSFSKVGTSYRQWTEKKKG